MVTQQSVILWQLALWVRVLPHSFIAVGTQVAQSRRSVKPFQLVRGFESHPTDLKFNMARRTTWCGRYPVTVEIQMGSIPIRVALWLYGITVIMSDCRSEDSGSIPDSHPPAHSSNGSGYKVLSLEMRVRVSYE